MLKGALAPAVPVKVPLPAFRTEKLRSVDVLIFTDPKSSDDGVTDSSGWSPHDEPTQPTAVTVTGLPWNVPVAVAVSVFPPAARTQLPTLAIPAAFVVCVAPVRVPAPPVIANVT